MGGNRIHGTVGVTGLSPSVGPLPISPGHNPYRYVFIGVSVYLCFVKLMILTLTISL